MDEKCQAEVLEKHSEHVCKIAAGISVILAVLQPAFVEYRGAADPYTIGLLAELVALQKTLSVESDFLDRRLNAFLEAIKMGKPSS